jgi:hypothetical protein
MDKYIHLSLDAALLVLNQWASAATKLRLTAASASAGVSFSGFVTVVKEPPPSALSSRFACDSGSTLGASLFDAEGLRASAEEPRRWLAFDKPGDFRFVLEVNEGEPLEEINLNDFGFVSPLEQ